MASPAAGQYGKSMAALDREEKAGPENKDVPEMPLRARD
jgi:hypothetical protein